MTLLCRTQGVALLVCCLSSSWQTVSAEFDAKGRIIDRPVYKETSFSLINMQTGLAKHQFNALEAGMGMLETTQAELNTKITATLSELRGVIGVAKNLVTQVAAPVASALLAINWVKDQYALVTAATDAQTAALADCARWHPIAEGVQSVIDKAVQQAVEEAEFQKTRAEELQKMGDARSIELLQQTLSSTRAKIGTVETDQRRYLLDPLQSVADCARSVDTKSSEYNNRWAVGQWWHSTAHLTEMSALQGCIKQNMEVVLAGVDVFNSKHIVDIKKGVMEATRAVDGVRMEVREQADRHIAAVAGSFEGMSQGLTHGLSTLRDEAGVNHKQTLQLMAGLSTNAARTEGFVEALARGFTDQMTAQTEMQKEMVKAITAGSKKDQDLIALLARKDSEILHLRQELDKERATSSEWRRRCHQECVRED